MDSAPRIARPIPVGGPSSPRLLDRVRLAIRSRHYSPRTEEAYISWIKRYIFFHDKRHPAEMGAQEVTRFLARPSWPCQRVYPESGAQRHPVPVPRSASAGFAMARWIVRAKRPSYLPVVLTQTEVQTVLAHLRGVPRLMGTLLYGAGLRLMECARLRVKDVDFASNQILVRDGTEIGCNPLQP